MSGSGLDVMAISSGGGHWVQLKRLVPAFEGHRVSFVTVHDSYRSQFPEARFHIVQDASRWSKLALLRTAFRMLWIMLRERPDLIVSTGAAPGYLGVLFGKLVGARTIWVDSIANAERLSLSGEKAGRIVDLWLTQWPHLARPDGPRYMGSVL